MPFDKNQAAASVLAFSVNAVADQDDSTPVVLGATVTASSGTLTYAWAVYPPDSASDVGATVLSDATAAAPTLTFGDYGGLLEGMWTIQLTLSDEISSLTDTETVTLGSPGWSVSVNAVADHSDTAADTLGVTVAGQSGAVTYAWSVYPPDSTTDVAATVLSDATAAAPTLTYTSYTGRLAGTWTIVCTVTDALGSLSDTELVTLGRDGWILQKNLDFRVGTGLESAWNFLVDGDTYTDSDGDSLKASNTGNSSANAITATGIVSTTSAAGGFNHNYFPGAWLPNYDESTTLFMAIQRVKGALGAAVHRHGLSFQGAGSTYQFLTRATTTGIDAETNDPTSAAANTTGAVGEPEVIGLRICGMHDATTYYAISVGTWPPIPSDLTEGHRMGQRRAPAVANPLYTFDATGPALGATTQRNAAADFTSTTVKICFWTEGR